MILDVGVRARLVGKNDDGRIYHISAVETHGELTFYRLREIKGALFLRSSLEEVNEHKA